MKLYRIDLPDDQINGEGHIVAWAGSTREAATKAHRMNEAYLTLGNSAAPNDKAKVKPVDVPTNKAGLLVWLNVELTRANG